MGLLLFTNTLSHNNLTRFYHHCPLALSGKSGNAHIAHREGARHERDGGGAGG